MSDAAAALSSEGSWGDDLLLSAARAGEGGAGGASGAAAAAAPLPPTTEEFEAIPSFGSAETAIKTQITYRYNEKGEVEKVTRKFRVVTVRTRQSEAVRLRREGLLKFGAALNAAENATLTKVSPEDIFLELPSAGAEREERATREAFSGGVRGALAGEGLRRRAHRLSPPPPPSPPPHPGLRALPAAPSPPSLELRAPPPLPILRT